jgi:TPR repeat protein
VVFTWYFRLAVSSQPQYLCGVSMEFYSHNIHFTILESIGSILLKLYAKYFLNVLVKKQKSHGQFYILRKVMRFMWDRVLIGEGNRKWIEKLLERTFQTSINWRVFPQALNVLNPCMRIGSFLCEFVSRSTLAAQQYPIIWNNNSGSTSDLHYSLFADFQSICHNYGIGFEINKVKALYGHEQGFGNAQFNLDLWYNNGIFTEKDGITNFYWCHQKAAENGDKNAQFSLGTYYYHGIGIEKDEAKPFYWFQKAAENGVKEAQFNLGICYQNGDCTKKDEVKAFYWYHKAAESGIKEAQYNLGTCYENGNGTEIDEKKAFYWYQKAAEKGLKQAQFNLGVYYESGICIGKDEVKALYWFKKAAENGVKEAQFNLGLCYENGNGIVRDEVKAFCWYHKAAEDGLKEAQYNLGACYKNGDGIEKDEIKAFYWYQKAAENGYEKAQFNLGYYYFNGIGTEKDKAKAFYWYQKAVENGLKDAQFNPRKCHNDEVGVEKDEVNISYGYHKPEKECLNVTKWIENAVKYEKIKFIPYTEIENTELLCKGGFGHISKAIWTKTNNYVICKKLTNTPDTKNDLLDAFIHELKINLHLNYSDRIIRCLGISLGN